LSRQLQKRAFDQSTYNRPNADWVCGRSGRPCSLGPDGRGECVTRHECVPSIDGSRWQCTRPASFGGPCVSGPLPDGTCCKSVPRCQPELSLRARRKRLVRWTISLTLGLLALGLSRNQGRDLIDPGPVAHPHGTVEEACEACHGAGLGGPTHWVSSALMPSQATSDSSRCLKCHNLGRASLHPHSTAPEVLAAKSEALVSRVEAKEFVQSSPILLAMASIGPGVPGEDEGLIACAACHKEHQGADHDLTRMSNDQCQVCHVVRFESFADGHPSLRSYPYGRRTRLIFDHDTHRNDYYEGDFACIQCHAPETTGATMLLQPYEVSCLECHEELVSDDNFAVGQKGLRFISLPSLDVWSLRDSRMPLGQWPSVSKRKSENQQASPFMDLLLAGQPSLTLADRGTLAGLDLSNLEGANQYELDAVVRYAWAIKLLLSDLADSGHRAIAERLNSEQLIGDRDLSPDLVRQLMGGLGRETIEDATRQWFPNLRGEMRALRSVMRDGDRLDDLTPRRQGDLRRSLARMPREDSNPRSSSRKGGREGSRDGSREGWVRDGGWYWTQRDAVLRHRIRGHADAFLRAWLDFSAGFALSQGRRGDIGDIAGRLFESLSKVGAVGSCMTCHSVDPEIARYGPPGLARTVNWRSFRPEQNRRLATAFRHQPHFSIDDAQPCDTCHKLRKEGHPERFKEAYAAASPDNHSLNFEPIAREQCAECHVASAAGDDCVECHNYHLGEFVPIYLTATPGAEALAATALQTADELKDRDREAERLAEELDGGGGD